MDTYAHGYGLTGHYRRPGMPYLSYCGRDLLPEPNTAIANRVCQSCAKAQARDRAAAEQVAADHATDGPTLAERAGVRYCEVGTGRRVHYSNNDDTLCGYEVSEYTDGPTGEQQLCARCIKAAEKRAYARAVAAADREAAAAFAAVARAVDAVEHAEETGAAVATVEDAEALYAAALVTEVEADEGTWRGEWIGEQQPADVLFTVAGPIEQGALFTAPPHAS
ncbi:hypothetical protein ABT234_05135 [Streptomyces sp. NPDC001586]|uniref:hypothetical protein n=1 Tax=unclassified Streptomyces TaxID=2593676 RepID=UPI00332947C7